MMNRRGILSAVGLFLLFVLSCSGSSGGPVSGELDEPIEPGLTDGQGTASTQSGAYLWGIWDVYVDPEKETIEAVPLRGAAFTLNAVTLVDSPPSNLHLNIVNVDKPPGYVDIEVEVGLQHPYPGLNTCPGFDVMGVFMGDGTEAYLGPDGFPIAGGNDQRMFNPDGYTRWFNAPEFAGAGAVGPLLGYVPGTRGTPGYTPSAELNPYRYFADGLGAYGDAFDFLVANAADRGSFTPGIVNWRYYEIRFPDTTGIKFQYAVIAHWKSSGLPDPIIDDFPPEANADEALVIDVDDSASTAYYDNGQYGGYVRLDISVWDWSVDCGGVLEYEIMCYSDAWSGAYAVNMTPTGSVDNYCTFYASIPVDVLTSSDPLPVWIEVNYPSLGYQNNFGVVNNATGTLAGYFQTEVPIGDTALPWIQVLTPNGGEEWAVGSVQEITWDSGDVTGTVVILYSKDNFITDNNTIATDETNDGSYMWDIPLDPSTTVRVRVRATNPSYLGDNSDADFSIVDSGWARTWGDAGNDPGRAVATDYWGNAYVAGYTGTPPDSDAFLAKYDTTGTLLWYKTWGGANEVQAWGVAVEFPDIVCVTGHFKGTADFDPGAGISNHSSNGDYDVFLSMFDQSGNFQWARTWGAASTDKGSAVAVDSWGSVLVTGLFESTVDFDPGGGTENQSSNGEEDVFLSQFDSDGNFYWARTWGGTDWDWGNGVTVYGAGNVYVTGDFKETVDFDPGVGTDNHASNGYFDTFLSKFNSSGLLQWARTWGGTKNDRGLGVAADDSGTVYVTGEFEETVDFDPGTGNETYICNGWWDVYVNKFNSSGDQQWARTWGSTLGDRGRGVAVDDSGNVYTSGEFTGTVDFDPGGGTDDHTSNGGHDIFLSKLDASGVFLWARTWGGHDSAADGGDAVAVDDQGNAYVSGAFYGLLVDFAPKDPPCGEPSDVHNSNGNFDAFLTKHLPDGCW